MKTVYSSENVSFQYDATSREMYQKWENYVRPEAFRSAVDAFVQILDEYPADYIICDTTTQKAVSPREVEYSSAAVPKMFGKGVRFICFLLSEHEFGKRAAERFTKVNRDQINIGHFASVEDARSWVRENAG